MRKIILTSSGFDNRNISDKFIELINKEPRIIRVLFIPTAAITEEQRNIIPLCKKELVDIGIKDNHIVSYDFERKMEIDELMKFDTVYVCGGSTKLLLDRMNSNLLPLEQFINQDGIYLGVSAGSIALTSTHDTGLGFIDCRLNVHQKKGTRNGSVDVDLNETINLTDDQALIIIGDEMLIFQ